MCAQNSDSTSFAETPPKAGFGKRIHAWLLARCTVRYERMVADRKRGLFAGLRGNILEIGPGAGPNLVHYPRNCRWIGVEPNPYMHPYLRKAAERAGLRIEIRTLVAEKLPAADETMDAVVSTLVLCSVSDPEVVLREILRVLRPGGRFLFLEHVAAAQGTRLRKVQRIIRPVWRRLADGCHPDRDTGLVIERAGFGQVHYENFRLSLGPVSTQIAGFAVK